MASRLLEGLIANIWADYMTTVKRSEEIKRKQKSYH